MSRELLLSALCLSLGFFLSGVRKSESNEGVSFGLIVTLTSSRYLSVKRSIAFSVEKKNFPYNWISVDSSMIVLSF